MSAFVSNGKLYLNGAVGAIPGEPDFFSYEDVMRVLDGLDREKKHTVVINSFGGYASEGLAIYSALASLPKGVDVIVEGIAASSGSVIAMAGRSITMAAGSVMMIHDASGFTIGNGDDHRRALENLEVTSNTIAGVYAIKTRKTVAACRGLMKAETWFEPQQAVTAGFADKVMNTTQVGMVFAAFDYTRFQNAPQKLIELARANNWKENNSLPQNPKEPTMTNPTPSAARTEAVARIKAILTHAEAEGRTELAEHIAYETDMEPEAAIAMLAKSGKSVNPGPQTVSYEQRRTRDQDTAFRNVAGLARPEGFNGAEPNQGGLVANMKRRHGIK